MIDKEKISLSVIIPCFNEEKTIQEVVKRINYLGINNLEIIVVDDGSTDGTNLKIEEIKNQINIIISYFDLITPRFLPSAGPPCSC